MIEQRNEFTVSNFDCFAASVIPSMSFAASNSFYCVST